MSAKKSLRRGPRAGTSRRRVDKTRVRGLLWIAAGLLAACGGAPAVSRPVVSVPALAANPSLEPADPADLSWQVANLETASLRLGAIENIYTRYRAALQLTGALDDAPELDEAPRSVARTCGPALAALYVRDPTTEAAERALEVLVFMYAPEGWPAFLAALSQSNPSRSIALRAIGRLDRSTVDEEEFVVALATALEASDTRWSDSFRIMQFLGELRHPRASTMLRAFIFEDGENVARRSFRARGLTYAYEALAARGDPTDVDTFLRCLVAGGSGGAYEGICLRGIARIGEPALATLVAVLDSGRPDLVELAEANPVEPIEGSADSPTAESRVALSAIAALGALGSPRAVDTLLAQMTDDVPHRRVVAANALASLVGLAEQDRGRVREALTQAYRNAPRAMRGALLVAMGATRDPAFLPVFENVIRTSDDPNALLGATSAFCLLATAREARRFPRRRLEARLERMARRDPELAMVGLGIAFALRYLSAASACDTDAACWARRLVDTDADNYVRAKAVAMLGRLGRAEDLPLLIRALPDQPADIQTNLVLVIDRLTPQGSPAALEAIEPLTASRNMMSRLAVALREVSRLVVARLRARAAP